MATGILGAVDLAATTNTIVYTVPSGKQAVCNVNICNRTGGAITVRLAISTSLTPLPQHYLEYDITVGANNPLERTALVINYGYSIIAYSSSANVSVMAWGYEENV